MTPTSINMLMRALRTANSRSDKFALVYFNAIRNSVYAICRPDADDSVMDCWDNNKVLIVAWDDNATTRNIVPYGAWDTPMLTLPKDDRVTVRDILDAIDAHMDASLYADPDGVTFSYGGITWDTCTLDCAINGAWRVYCTYGRDVVKALDRDGVFGNIDLDAVMND